MLFAQAVQLFLSEREGLKKCQEKRKVRGVSFVFADLFFEKRFPVPIEFHYFLIPNFLGFSKSELLGYANCESLELIQLPGIYSHIARQEAFQQPVSPVGSASWSD